MSAGKENVKSTFIFPLLRFLEFFCVGVILRGLSVAFLFILDALVSPQPFFGALGHFFEYWGLFSLIPFVPYMYSVPETEMTSAWGQLFFFPDVIFLIGTAFFGAMTFVFRQREFLKQARTIVIVWSAVIAVFVVFTLVKLVGFHGGSSADGAPIYLGPALSLVVLQGYVGFRVLRKKRIATPQTPA